MKSDQQRKESKSTVLLSATNSLLIGSRNTIDRI